MPDAADTTTLRRSNSAGPAPGENLLPADRFEPECEIGLIALATDHAIEDEMRRFLPADGRAALYTTRVPTPDDFGLESLRATASLLADGASRLVPGSRLDVVAYGCTSATAAIGEERVFAEIRKARPGIACTTPMTAADAALRRLGANRIVLVTPYPEPVHATVVRAIESRGFAIVDHSFFGIGSDFGITQVPQSRLAETVRARVSDTVRSRAARRRRCGLHRLHRAAHRRPDWRARARTQPAGDRIEPRDGLARARSLRPQASRRRRAVVWDVAGAR